MTGQSQEPAVTQTGLLEVPQVSALYRARQPRCASCGGPTRIASQPSSRHRYSPDGRPVTTYLLLCARRPRSRGGRLMRGLARLWSHPTAVLCRGYQVELDPATSGYFLSFPEEE